jgi:predicted amidohydrolase YtcJ
MTDFLRLAGGQIFTGSRTVESLVIEGGRVVAAGSEAEARRTSPTGTVVVRLDGQLVIPGLVDAHLHLADLTRAREGLSLRDLRSLPGLVTRLEAWMRDHPAGPVVGYGWSVEQLSEQREPTARDLDRASGDRPVVLYHVSGHAAVLNRAALEAVGYGAGSPDPPGGRLGRAPDGSPDGRVYEAAMSPVGHLVRAATMPGPEAVRRTVRLLNAFGVTTVGSLSTTPPELESLRVASAGGETTLRIRCYMRLNHWDDLPVGGWSSAPSPDLLAVVGVKAFVDGAFGPRTAWLVDPYADRPAESGLPVLREAELVEFLRRCAREGRQPAVHAIGDRALVEVLRGLERLGGDGPRSPRIEHASLVPPTSFPLLDRIRPTLIIQPGFVWSDEWLEQRLGAARARWAYPFRSLLDRGYALGGSTDSPYDPPDPWRGLAAAVTRVSPNGASANPATEEALTPAEALGLFTTGAARALGEPSLGALEPGSPGDFVVLEARDVAEAIRGGAGRVESTWFSGRRVFDREMARGPTTV